MAAVFEIRSALLERHENLECRRQNLHNYSEHALQKLPETSMIGAMFSGKFATAEDANGNIFVDNNGSAFHVVLNYLR